MSQSSFSSQPLFLSCFERAKNCKVSSSGKTLRQHRPGILQKKRGRQRLCVRTLIKKVHHQLTRERIYSFKIVLSRNKQHANWNFLKTAQDWQINCRIIVSEEKYKQWQYMWTLDQNAMDRKTKVEWNIFPICSVQIRRINQKIHQLKEIASLNTFAIRLKLFNYFKHVNLPDNSFPRKAIYLPSQWKSPTLLIVISWWLSAIHSRG